MQHAHRSLVVHRDLKPANILVTPSGDVKLLDFGIAKMLGGDGAGGRAALTSTVDRLMTPLYASPAFETVYETKCGVRLHTRSSSRLITTPPFAGGNRAAKS